MPQDKIKEVYDLISDLGYFANENEFRGYVSDPNRRKEAYELISDAGYFADENEFNSYFDGEKKKSTQMPFTQPFVLPSQGGGESSGKPSQLKSPSISTPTSTTTTTPKQKKVAELPKYDPTSRIKLYTETSQRIQQRIPQLVEAFNVAEQSGDAEEAARLQELINVDSERLNMFEQGIKMQKDLAKKNEASSLAIGLDNVMGGLMAGVNFLEEFQQNIFADLTGIRLSEETLKGIDEVNKKIGTVRPSDALAKAGKEILEKSKIKTEEKTMNMPYQGGVWEALKKGDVKAASSNAGTHFVMSLPQSVLMANPITGSLLSAGMAQQSVDEERAAGNNVTSSDYMVGAAKAATEYVFENMFGTGKALKEMVQALGNDAARKAIEKTAKAGLKEWAKKVGANVTEETFGEGLTQISQNLIDIANGKKVGVLDGVADAALIGLFGGMTQGTATTTITHYVDRAKLKEYEVKKEKAIQLQEQALEAPSEVVAEAIEVQAAKINEEADAIAEENNEIGANADPEIIAELEQENADLDELEAALPESPPEVQEAIQAQIDEKTKVVEKLTKEARLSALERLKIAEEEIKPQPQENEEATITAQEENVERLLEGVQPNRDEVKGGEASTKLRTSQEDETQEVKPKDTLEGIKEAKTDESVPEKVSGSVGVGGENPALKDETPILSTPKILSTDGLPDLEIVASKESSQALESEIGGDKGVIDKNVRTIPIQEYDVASNKRSKQIAEQIEENGWIEPLIVSYDKSGNVYIVEGQHRAAALKELGYDKAPVIVIHEKDLGKQSLKETPQASSVGVGGDVKSDELVVKKIADKEIKRQLDEQGYETKNKTAKELRDLYKKEIGTDEYKEPPRNNYKLKVVSKKQVGGTDIRLGANSSDRSIRNNTEKYGEPTFDDKTNEYVWKTNTLTLWEMEDVETGKKYSVFGNKEYPFSDIEQGQPPNYGYIETPKFKNGDIFEVSANPEINEKYSNTTLKNVRKQAQSKAVEQSLKETPKAETKPITDPLTAKQRAKMNELVKNSEQKTDEEIRENVIKLLQGDLNISRDEAEALVDKKYKTETPQAGSVGVGGDKSILNSDVDLKGNKKETWMLHETDYQNQREGDWNKIEKNAQVMSYRHGISKEELEYSGFKTFDDYYNNLVKKGEITQTEWDNWKRYAELNKEGKLLPSNKLNISIAISDGEYQKAISEGRMTATDAKTIIESAGLEIPKDISEQSLKEKTVENESKSKKQDSSGDIGSRADDSRAKKSDIAADTNKKQPSKKVDSTEEAVSESKEKAKSPFDLVAEEENAYKQKQEEAKQEAKKDIELINSNDEATIEKYFKKSRYKEMPDGKGYYFSTGSSRIIKKTKKQVALDTAENIVNKKPLGLPQSRVEEIVKEFETTQPKEEVLSQKETKGATEEVGQEVTAKTTVDLIKEAFKNKSKKVKVVFKPAYDEKEHGNLSKKLKDALKVNKVSEFDVISESESILSLVGNNDVLSIEYVSEPTSKKAKADAAISFLENLKADTKNKSFDAVLGIPIGIWNAAIDTITLSIKAGVSISDAIKRGLNYIQKNHRGAWDKKGFNQKVLEELGLRGIEVNGEDLIVKPVEKEFASVVNGFYSDIEQSLLDTNKNNLSGKDWISALGNSDEANWTGLTDWLSQQQGSVSKADIQQYLKDNRIQVVEVVKGEAEDAGYDNFQKQVEKAERKFGVRINIDENPMDGSPDVQISGEKLDNMTDDEIQELQDEVTDFVMAEAPDTEQNTKFSQYQLEGEKENYKEVLVTLPSKGNLKERWGVFNDKGKLVSSYNSEAKAKEKSESIGGTYRMASNVGEADPKVNFKSSHFDEANILVHLRMNTRTDADGNKVLFLEEVQSDFNASYRKSQDMLLDYVNKNENEVIELYKKSGKLKVIC